MKILKADQIRSWDQYTIEHEPVASIDLMERAATKCFEWLDDNGWFVHSFAIFCGKGNNGGDGLAIARMLAVRGCKVSVYILEFGHKGTDDFQTNLARLHQYPQLIFIYTGRKHFSYPDTRDCNYRCTFWFGVDKAIGRIYCQTCR
jgi:NAD(P)H-hydrate epimerase